MLKKRVWRGQFLSLPWSMKCRSWSPIYGMCLKINADGNFMAFTIGEHDKARYWIMKCRSRSQDHMECLKSYNASLFPLPVDIKF